MLREIDLNDEFTQNLLAKAAAVPPSEPRAYYNPDGDCIEFLLSDEGYKAERIDKLVTVYYGRESGQIVGSLIKGVKRFIQETVETCPGFVIEIEDGKVKLGHIFTAGMWRQGEKMIVLQYKKLRDSAELYGIEVSLQPAAA